MFFLEFIQSKYVAPVQWYKIGLVKLQKHTKTRDFRTSALDMLNRLQESWTDFENYKETVGQRSRKLPETLKKSQEFPEISRGSQKLPEKYGIYDYQLWVNKLAGGESQRIVQCTMSSTWSKSPTTKHRCSHIEYQGAFKSGPWWRQGRVKINDCQFIGAPVLDVLHESLGVIAVGRIKSPLNRR